MLEYRWNRWNVQHIAEHGIVPEDAEYVMNRARSPYPRYEGDGRYRAIGRRADGTYMQVVFVFDPPGVVYVIHARPLTDREKRAFRRRSKP